LEGRIVEALKKPFKKLNKEKSNLWTPTGDKKLSAPNT